MNRVGKIITAVGATALASIGTYFALSKNGKEKVQDMMDNITNNKANNNKNLMK